MNDKYSRNIIASVLKTTAFYVAIWMALIGSIELLITSCATPADASKYSIGSPYNGLGMRELEFSSRGGMVYRLKFGLHYPKGNKSPQPSIVIPKVVYGPGQVILSQPPGKITVSHSFVKAVLTGAIEGVATGNFAPHAPVDEGGGITWYATTTLVAKSVRAGTVYCNVFDDKGDMMAYTTFEVDKNEHLLP